MITQKIYIPNFIKIQKMEETIKLEKKDFIEFENIKLKCCDYKELLEEMKEEKIKVDCILTDPPYCISRKNNFKTMGRAGIDFGKWDYNFNQTEWIKNCIPFLNDGGSIIIFNDWKNLSYIVEALEDNGCIVKDLLRWEKLNPMPRNVNSRYVIDFECAIWAVKGKKRWVFNKPENVSYIKAVFKSGVVPGGKKRLHPTQKHLNVIEGILSIHTNENDLIFDPFSGSGTTALACLNNSRKFIGSEIDERYFKNACKRLIINIREKQ